MDHRRCRIFKPFCFMALQHRELVPATLYSFYVRRHYQHVKKGQWLEEALKSAEFMQQQQKMSISKGLAHRLVSELAKRRDIELGRRVRSILMHDGLDSVPVLANHLIRLFASCGSLGDAQQVFHKVSKPDQYTWNAIIDAHAKLGKEVEALCLGDKMQHMGLKPDRFTFMSMLKACGSMGALDKGKQIHKRIGETGMQLDIVLGSTVVDMYAKCGSLDEARRVFDTLADRDVVAWNAMIAGYSQHGQGHLALDCYKTMQQQGISPSKMTFSSILKACGSIGAIDHGKKVHQQITALGLQSDTVVGSALVDMYVKCEKLEDAEGAFNGLANRNVVAWTSMIAGYAQHGKGLRALECFDNMQRLGVQPNNFTFASVLKACGFLQDIERGKHIHKQILESGIQSDVVVGSTLVDMYCKCGSLEDAHKIFEKLPIRDVIAWNEMIAGYAMNGEGRLAIECFENMQIQGMRPDEATFCSILKACSSIGAIEQGRRVHKQIAESGLQSAILPNALVDMYAKCGSLEEARQMFESLPARNVISWSAMLAGYAQLGDGDLAVQCFREMQTSGIKPDDIAFSGILSACSRGGLIDEGIRQFNAMQDHHGKEPNVFHINCMVDLLGRSGFFNEAEDLFRSATHPNIYTWMILLSACRMHCNVDLGRRCFNEVVSLDPLHTQAYVLMSNIYATARMGNDVSEVERLRKNAGACVEFNDELNDGICPRIDEGWLIFDHSIGHLTECSTLG